MKAIAVLALLASTSPASAEAPMSDDPDLLKSNYALQVLRQARLSRTEQAAKMVEHLAYVTINTGIRPPEIEETQQAAWAAISELAKVLNEEGFAGPTLWKAAVRATESWIELLIRSGGASLPCSDRD
jgi:hypothetical protein